jgi:hypothetical protein
MNMGLMLSSYFVFNDSKVIPVNSAYDICISYILLCGRV